MHELSIAQNLVELAAEEARRRGLTRVRAVHVRLGVLAGVVKDALLFCFDIVTAGTPLEGARLAIEEVPVEIFCPRCRQPRRLPEPLPMACPECGTRTAEIVHGRELELFALEGEEGEGLGAPDR
ncbi:hydrogenase maturation nickel metallochaperone HypA [Thermaerobacter sp. PB12/4term]|uniref:hydrogenase maturation nickel metallochaperone HypA n=1 Tax=Thermaerobacter sp. PB12/4term TaxID=2293838 RepID=UPI000E32789D|nr:hydrogenase maturation nickel metallochaperone HypA [Thermaerobacter sp. PB12/4term]QIA27591.1 hydrogenase maturation nickel metallochaperone HypA [Thermaerobacter sp. PB12/4term]